MVTKLEEKTDAQVDQVGAAATTAGGRLLNQAGRRLHGWSGLVNVRNGENVNRSDVGQNPSVRGYLVGEAGRSATPVESMVELPGRRIATLTWGSPHGPLVMLLHGFPDTAWSWRLVAPVLADRGWRVVAPFSRGYAPSDLAPDGCYQLGALVRDVMELYAALEGDSRAVLVGHDWGSMTAHGVGALANSPFARVVTMSVPPFATSRRVYRQKGAPGRALRQLRCSWYILFNQIPRLPERVFPRLVRRLWADWSPGLDASAELTNVAQALPTRERRAAAITYYRDFVQPWRRSSAYAEEQRACTNVPAAPTLYLHGAQDGALLPEIGAQVAQDLSAGSRAVMIAGAGHFLQLEQPEAVAVEILRFIGSGLER
jgi:pimeloyl-ACP methyl ester carboxylesterase